MSTTEFSHRYISSPIYPRMVGYIATLAMHTINGLNMYNTFSNDEVTDLDVIQFNDDQLKFLTVWNVYLQLFYAGLGLSCDVLTLTSENKDGGLLKTLKRTRESVFSGLVFPISVSVFSIFWTVFSYDRSLILPPSVEMALGHTGNHVIHTMILPVVLWEVAFRPRSTPESHTLNLVHLNTFITAYLLVLLTSYVQLGTWVYPILNLLDGTVFFYVLIGISVIIIQISYYLQWYLTLLVWANPERVKKS